MAFTSSNVTFKTTSAYLTKADLDSPFEAVSSHELDERSVLYGNEFAINPYSKSVLTNKFGEMLIRQLIDEEEGEYMYYVVVFGDRGCECCKESFIGYSHTHFDSNLEYILENYFNESETNVDYIGLHEENQRYAVIYPEYNEVEMEEYDEIGWRYYVSTHSPVSDNDVFVYTEEDGNQLYHFTDDYSIIPSINRENSNYSKKYQLVVSACGIPIQTPDGKYISCMKKNNGKHRYYITNIKSELISDDLYYKPMSMFYVFKSHYIGNDLGSALQEYVYAPQTWM